MIGNYLFCATLLKRQLKSTTREHNMVRFHDGKPTGIYYSQHRDGAAYDWDNDAISKTNERVSRRNEDVAELI